MNLIFSSGCFIGFVIAGFAAALVFARNPQSVLNRSFLGSACASAVYNLLVGLFFLSGSSLYWSGFVHHASVTAWLIFLVTQLYFSMALARVQDRAPNRFLLWLVTVSVLTLAVLDWLGATIYQLPVASIYGMRSFPGPYYYVFTGFSILVAGLQFAYFTAAWLKTKNRKEREQVFIVMTGLAAGSLIGVFFDIIAPLGGFFSQSFAWLASAAYVSSFAYAMVRYGMLAITPSTIAGDIVNTMPDLLVVTGLDRRIRLVNQRIVKQLGYLAEDLIDKTIEQLIVAPNAAAFSARIETVLENDGVVKEELTRLRGRNGEVFPVRLDACRARDQFNNELGNILIFRDVSEEEELLEKQEAMIAELTSTKERVLSILEDTAAARDEAKHKAGELAKALEDLKAVDKMKNEFLSVISHELRTPLTPIKGYASLLLSGQMGNLSKEQTNAIEIIRREEEHLLSLINSVLDISRLSAGKSLQITKAPVLIKRLLEDITQAMAPQFASRQIGVEIALPADFPTIKGDTDKLTQLLANILGNVLKFTPAQGHVKVKGYVRENNVEIEVTDNGIGVARENLEKIFDKFFQVDGSITRTAGGVGLGLAIAREIVEAHGGRIWAESEGLGRGTTIKFTLPIV